jgi:hypothetical protein
MKIDCRVVANRKYIEVNIHAENTTIDLGWHNKQQAKELRDLLTSAIEDIDYYINDCALGSAGKAGEQP